MQFTATINLSGLVGPKAALSHMLHVLASRLVNFNEGMAGEMEGQMPDPDGKAIGKWEIREAPEGRTLSDFANSRKLFKRPMHGNAYTVRERLLEIHADGRTFLPRLTAEDLTATDWEEVEPDYGPNNTTNTGEDGLLPALS